MSRVTIPHFHVMSGWGLGTRLLPQSSQSSTPDRKTPGNTGAAANRERVVAQPKVR